MQIQLDGLEPPEVLHIYGSDQQARPPCTAYQWPPNPATADRCSERSGDSRGPASGYFMLSECAMLVM